MSAIQAKKKVASFPRGKKDKDPNQAIEKVDRKKDDLFNTEAPKSETKKSKKKKTKANRHENSDPLTITNVSSLTYRDLHEGFVLLGCVSSVGDYELKMSLPGHLVGTVPIANISRPYTKALKDMVEKQDEDSESILTLKEMFKPGQVYLCSVVKVDANERNFCKVVLSLSPQDVHSIPPSALKKGHVLQAAVKSVEDHGYIMDVGLTGKKAFLGEKSAEKLISDHLEGKPLAVGQLVPTCILKNDVNLLTLTADPNKLATSLLNPLEYSVHALSPGCRFNATVTESLRGGIKVKIANFHAYVPKIHISHEVEEGAKVEVEILYIVPTVNTIYATTKPHLILGRPLRDPFCNVQVGQTLHNVKVIESEKSGLMLRLNEDDIGFVSYRQVTESKEIPNLKEKYPVGKNVSCRIIQYDFLDDTFICSMQKSALNQTALYLNEMKPGDVVSCSVKELNDKGAVVKVGKDMQGFISNIHLSDVPLKHPEKKFFPGTKLKCRVLKVDPQRRKLELTNKSILVNEEYPIISTYDPANIGTITEGVVASISSHGLILHMYGEAKGFVPKSMISTEVIEYPEKLFFIGQTLKCWVFDVRPEKKKMTLSLIIGGTHKPLGRKEKKSGEKIKFGHFYDCVIMEKTSNGLNVSVTIHDNEEKVNAFIPMHHLTDHPALAGKLLNSYSDGDKIKNAVCYEKDILPILSLKPTIVQAVKEGHLPKNFDELQVGITVPGVVCMIKSYGIFLRLPVWKFRKSALVPTRLLANSFVENVTDFVVMGQTLMGKVVERDDQAQTVTMTTNVEEFTMSIEQGILNLKSFLYDKAKILENGPFADIRNDLVMTCKVKKSSGFGLEVDANGAKGLITNSHLLNLNVRPSKGQVIPAVVLYIDPEFDCVELSADPDLIRKCSFFKQRKLQPGTIVRASVVLIKSDLFFATLVVKTGPFAGVFVHVPLRYHMNDQFGIGKPLELGAMYTIMIKDVEFEPIGCFEDQNLEQKQVKKKKRKLVSENQKMATETPNEDNDVKEPAKKISKVELNKKELPETSDPGWDEDFDPWTGGKSKDMEDDAEEGQSPSKKLKTHISKKEKKELAKLEIEEIARAEQRVLDGEVAEPETIEEFERLVFSSPNSSLCWIKYMAHLLMKNDPTKAREVAKRALEKISFREEEERMNVYMAWLNLENDFGTEAEADSLLTDILKCNDQYNVYMKVLDMYESGNKQSKAEKLLKTMIKKFRKEKDVWIKMGTHYFKHKNLKEARFTLQRSIQNLDEKDHVDITSRFGQLEFKMGEAERGKTVFETILGNFPGRTDLWSVYVDMLVKSEQIEAARAVLDRMILLNLPPKKMKFFFKKYLEFEERQENKQGIDKVRKKALEYVSVSEN